MMTIGRGGCKIVTTSTCIVCLLYICSVVEVEAYDMFPHTSHVEMMTLLEMERYTELDLFSEL